MSLRHSTNFEMSDSGREDFILEIESMSNIIDSANSWEIYQDNAISTKFM